MEDALSHLLSIVIFWLASGFMRKRDVGYTLGQRLGKVLIPKRGEEGFARASFLQEGLKEKPGAGGQEDRRASVEFIEAERNSGAILVCR